MLADRVRMGIQMGFVDTWTNIGPKKLIKGNAEAGFFGETSVSDLITGDALSSAVGMSVGTSQFSNENWLKFSYKGNIQFIAKKPIRSYVVWGHINNVGCVYGTKIISIAGHSFRVRLIQGTNTNTPENYVTNADGDINHYSEWNRLILPLHIRAKDGSWGYPNNIEPDLEYWGIDYDDTDLLTVTAAGSGSRTYCQERTAGTIAVCRGVVDASLSQPAGFDRAGQVHDGWRPVLELVQ